MIGYIVTKEQGATDLLIESAALRFQDAGVAVAGAVQKNHGFKGSVRSKMVLDVMGTGETVTISQDLGPHASGCRLDAGALETAAQMVWESLDQPRELLLLNKFGKQERDGQGFRDVLVKALDNDIPVLLGVNSTLEQAFQEFSGDFAVKLEPTHDCIEKWFKSLKRD
ncbi:MAG: DUF2478 domain-containing protein [Paracoccaceae bacterium]|nr:DUF2478 domain-containing protein [Paracoccaceae bacterium]MDG2257164.1 DUF2478 domain-containing protein [Paracoccaceae bacterium]